MKTPTIEEILDRTCRKECQCVRKYGYEEAVCNFCRECALIAKYYEAQK